MTNSCEVCCERFSLQARKKVECPYCEYHACSSCHEKYLTGTIETPHCMSCRKSWNREIIHKNFTSKFINKTYKSHRESVLFDRERSLMPETQPYVEIRKACIKINDEINKKTVEMANFRSKNMSVMAKPLEMFGKLTYHEARIERHRSAVEFVKMADVCHRDIEHLNYQLATYQNPGLVESDKRKFVRACPANGCKGFLSTAWKCGLCEAKVCNKCHEIKKAGEEDEHVCNPDNVATAELLARDSKNCPKCASMIFKIAGCDQMYCTQCQTAFSWRTGRVETGTIHNPHYYDYMRTNGGLPRAVGDVVCGGIPHTSHIDTARHRITYTLQQRSGLLTIHRMHGHIQHVVMHRYRADGVADNRELRIKYMMDVISEAEFKKKLQQKEKSENKKREIRDVLDLYQTVTLDIMQKVAQDPDKNFMDEFHGIKEHAESLLEAVALRWNCVVPRFTNMWIIN